MNTPGTRWAISELCNNQSSSTSPAAKGAFDVARHYTRARASGTNKREPKSATRETRENCDDRWPLLLRARSRCNLL